MISRRNPLVLLLATLVLPAGAAHAGSVELDVNDEAARGTVAWNVRAETLGLDAGWFHHEDNGDVGHFGLHVSGAFGDAARAGVGLRAFAVDTSLGDGGAVGIGGYVRFPLPRLPQVELRAAGYLAPASLSGGDLDGHGELSAGLGYRVLDRAEVYVGYRLMEADYESGASIDVDESLHAGIRLEF